MITDELFAGLYEQLIQIPNEVLDNIMRKICEYQVNEGDTIIEVGANMGYHTRLFAEAVGDKGKVIAFEPFQENIDKLLKRLKHANIANRVDIHDYALSNYQGEAEFKIFKNSPGICGFIERPWYNKEQMETVKVRVNFLDNIIDLTNISFVKIDAEGADFDILQGGKNLIMKNRPLIIFEGGRIKEIPAKLYNFSKENFQRFFSSIEYDLYDNLGIPFDYRLWNQKALNDFIAVPVEKRKDIEKKIHMAVWSTLYPYLKF